MPILEGQSLDFLSHSPEQTQRFGVRLGEFLEPGHVVGLSGDLGSGKTTMVQGIARGWGSLDPITSPTFILINEYRRADGGVFYHVDAFRMENATEAMLLGIEELFVGRGPMVIEWSDRILPILPEERLWIELRWIDELRRGLRVSAIGPRYERLLDDFRQATFGK
jgi:tRNA threonylcarbamoyladenosine biosynthesis protein TsaE